ncbi:MAG TPA: peptidase MA family metallohydrolase [Thermoanaerobaculaceae bacterium]|nr:peptidase MA family metallohydrolase [Thermoanaerobaculaceae bacterium]
MEVGRLLGRGLVAGAVVFGVSLAAATPDSRAGGALALRVEAPPALARQASAVRALEVGDWRPVLKLVGLHRPGPPIRVVLAPEGSRLAANVASWVSGYAVPELGTIVLFPGRVPSYPDGNLEALLHHEVAHMLLARAAGGGAVPRWFNEGTATVAAREWGIEDGARVVLATIGRGPRSLTELDAGFSSGAAAVARSYAVSAALVRYLLRLHGDDVVGRILAGVSRGADFDDAFKAATGESVGRFASGYFRRETFWTTWVPVVTSSTVLWMAITVLALLAIKRRRERDALLREGWALEERARITGEVSQDPKDDPAQWN